MVKNNCRKTVDCGFCACDPPCPSGALCDEGQCLTCHVCASECDFASVQDAIDAANDGDAIHICPGRYGRISFSKARSLTLVGAGDGADPASDTILDAAGSGRTVSASGGGATTLRGLRITGGFVSTGGAGILNQNPALTMTRCTVTGNTSSSDLGGGGIFNGGNSTLTMTACVVSGNSATGPTGSGGGIFNNGGDVSMTDCAISGNTAQEVGGGIMNNALNDDDGTLMLVGCSVAQNRARAGGGIFSNTSTVTLDGTTVTENIAEEEGGAGGVHNADGAVTLVNGSAVDGNTQPNCVGTIDGSGCGP